MSKAGTVEVELVGHLPGLENALRRAEDRIQKFSSRTGRTLRAVGLGLTLGVTVPAVAAGAAAFKAAADMDSLERALTAVSGSSAATAAQLGRLKEVARAPGLGFKEAIAGSVRLQAVNISAKQAERTLVQFGNAVALSGGGRNELDRVTLQLQQMAGKGRILQEDLVIIMEAAPAMAGALQKAFGSTSAEAIRELGYDFDTFLDKLLGGLEQLNRVSTGPKNSMGNLTDGLFRAAAAAGNHLLPVLVPLIDRLGTLLEKTEGLDGSTVRWAIALGAVAAVAGPLILTLSGLATAAGALSIAMGTGLLPLVAVGAPLIAGLAYLSVRLVKDKLDALDAAAAVDRYRAALADLSGFSFADALGKQYELEQKLELVKAARAQLDEIEQRGRTGAGVQPDGTFVATTVLSKADRDAAKGLSDFLARNPEVEELEADIKRLTQRVQELRGASVSPIALPIVPPTKEEKDRLERIAETHARLRQEIATAAGMEQLLGAEFDENAAKASAYRTAIQGLLDEGLSPASAAVQEYAGKLRVAEDQIQANTNREEAFSAVVRKRVELQQDALAIFQRSLTPMEIYRQQLVTLQAALMEGVITQEQFNRSVSQINKELREATDTLTTTLRQAGEQAGESLIRGILSGADNMKAILKSFMIDLATTVIMASIKGRLGIASPSKEFHKLGQFTVLGFVGGIDSMLGKVEGSMARMATAIALPGLAASGVNMGAPAHAGAVQGAARIDIDLSRLPRPLTPFEAQRDNAWMELFSGSVDEFRSRGGRLS